MTERAICAIEAQQKKLDEDSAAFTVGEQLKDIVRTTAGAAELVVQDLQVEAMSLEACEKKISDFAFQHKKGDKSGISGKRADEIIRAFYGIGKAGEAVPPLREAVPPPRAAAKSINLLDFRD